MSINFPLILVLATGLTGLVWLIEIFLLRPRRFAAAEGMVESERESALTEPVIVEYSISFFPLTVTKFPLLILTSTPAGTLIGDFPILDMINDFYIKLLNSKFCKLFD